MSIIIRSDMKMPHIDHPDIRSLGIIIRIDGKNWVNPVIADYYDRYFSINDETAQGIIAISGVYQEAQRLLDRVEFFFFSYLIDIHPKSSRGKQLIRIGTERTRLLSQINYLPNSYATLYQLARLSIVEFENLVNSGTLHSLISTREVIKFRNKSASVAVLARLPIKNIYMDFQKLDDMEKITLWNKLSNIAREYNLPIDLDSRLLTKLVDLSLKAARQGKISDLQNN